MMMIKRQILTIVIACTVMISGCSLFPRDSELDELKKNKRSWQEQEIRNYTYISEIYCFCVVTGPAIVVVEEGNVVSLLDVETKEELMRNVDGEERSVLEVYPDLYPTIEQLFDVAIEANNRNAFVLDIEYQASPYRYPSTINIDYRENTADDEILYKASELVISTE